MPYMTRWTLKKSSAPKAIHGHATLSVWMKFMESLKIIEQLIDNIPEGAYQEKMKPIIRVPEGTYYAAVEGSRGEFGVFLESHGDKTPYRLHFRSTGLPLVSTVNTICRGAKDRRPYCHWRNIGLCSTRY